MHTRTTILTTSLLVAAVVLSACQAPADKVGTANVTLQFATSDGAVDIAGPAIVSFVDRLRELSGGELQVEIATDHGDGSPDAEASIVQAIAAGELDGGWPATRAFTDAGIPGLDAVEAPMTITNYDALRALVSGSVGDDVLTQLDGTGVVGLGLAVGGLRRPFAAQSPLAEPSDWKEARFRTYNSSAQAQAIRALGATPVNLTHTWHEELRAGTLQGAEIGIDAHQAGIVPAEATFVTSNVVLWPKVFVLSLSQQRYDTLTEEQRGWVQDAANQAVQASVDLDHVEVESTAAQQMCERGVRFVEADEAQLAALRVSFQPYLEQLAVDSASGPLLEEIQALGAEHPNPDVPAVPASCAEEPTAREVVFGEPPTSVAELPDGIYRVENTIDDVTAAGQSNGSGWTGTWTLTIEDGTWQLTCRPVDLPDRDCGNSGLADVPLEAGDARGSGDTLYLLPDPELMATLTGCQLPVSNDAGHCYETVSHRMTWSLDGEQLTFRDYASDDPGWIDWIYLLKPWQKVG
jgi:TRAP-type C4-dicarboxylate transport system substrate-binding protein